MIRGTGLIAENTAMSDKGFFCLFVSYSAKDFDAELTRMGQV